MSDMKLIMENWNKFQLVTEAQALHSLYENQIITEAEFMDRMRKWAMKKGVPLAVALSLATGAMAPPAYADDAPPEEPVAAAQAEAEAASMDVEEAAGLLGWIQLYQENAAEAAGPGREGLNARADLAQKLAPVQKALRQVQDGDPSALMQLDGSNYQLLQIFQKHFDKIPAAHKAEAAKIGHSIQVR